MTNEDEIRLLIGTLYTNLQSVEFLIRAALYKAESQPHKPIVYGKDLFLYKIGDRVPENALTDYSTLSVLIDRFNSLIANGNDNILIEKDLVQIRDALAHGRLACNIPNTDYTLLKFDKPKNAFVKVVFAQKITKDWLKEKIKFTHDQAIKVIKAGEIAKE